MGRLQFHRLRDRPPHDRGRPARRAGLSAALSSAFAQVVFIWSKSVVWTEVAAWSAEVVIWQSAERFLATLPLA